MAYRGSDRGNRKDGNRSADEARWGMSAAEMGKQILSLRKEGKGILKIGRELGVGTSVVQRVLVDPGQPRQLRLAGQSLRRGQ